MPEIKKQDYLKRDFESIRVDIEQILRVYFPEQWQDFNVASAGMSLIDLLAYVSDLLSFYTDKRFNELFLDGVTERVSAYRLAKTLGYKTPGVKASSTLVDITVKVPPISTGPDPQYLPTYRPGVRMEGAGQIFEAVNQIDFSNDFSDEGVANRIVEPNFDANQNIINYRITKREFCVAGATTLQKLIITEDDANTPFFEITLPESNVLEILDVIVKNGTNINTTPTYIEFKDFNIKYYEVDHLANNRVFLEDTGGNTSNGFVSGNWTEVNRRFTKEFLSDGRCKLTFGGGTPNVDAYAEYLNSLAITNSGDVNFKKVFDNTSLGEKLPPNSTIFIKYRIGGGEITNVGTRVINKVSNINAIILGADASKNNDVLSSTQATNVIPALGGKGLPSTQEIRYAASSNFAAQERCVTLLDYITRSKQLPGKFGAPFRISGRVDDNKVKLYILSKNSSGTLSDSSSSVVKSNIIEYLERFRMINDFIEINDAKVINLMFEIDLFTDKSFNQNEIRTAALQQVKDYFNIDDWEMNQHIYISQLTDIIREIPGVINVTDIRAFNLDGGVYSSTLISQANGPTEFLSVTEQDRTSAGDTRDLSGARKTSIGFIDNAIYSTPLSMFEIKYPDLDIKIRTA